MANGVVDGVLLPSRESALFGPEPCECHPCFLMRTSYQYGNRIASDFQGPPNWSALADNSLDVSGARHGGKSDI